MPKESADIVEEIEKLKKLISLLLYHNGVPPLDIARAAGMSPNDLYKFITKTKKRKKQSSPYED